MFLKTIEIQGFKSFADKVVFNFSPGVSAIVGPNGSGKSNVVDAIRWVLGEQSAKTLRGAKMEDVIFSGSVDRKPVGMARVSMILDNSQRIFAIDSDEVEVTRTLYRSGESNYMLNKSNCRLKDVQELFMDTGLGKDGFSVIGQGKIEEILTMHAEERRGLIEEAAGISKYKYRKREAERKLASTNDDMTRLDDILFELEKRIEPLSKQAEKVRVYRALKAEEDELQLAYLATNYTKERDAHKEAARAFDTQKSLTLTAQVALDQKEAGISEEKQALDEARHAMEEVQNAYTETLKATQENEKALSVLSEREEHLKASQVTLAAQLEENLTKQEVQQGDAVALQEELEKSKETLLEVEKNTQDRSEALSQLETKLSGAKEALETLRQEKYAVMSKQAELNNELARLEQALSGDEARKERLKVRLAQLLTQQAELHKAHEEKSNEAGRIEERLAVNRENQQKAKAERAQTERALTEEQERYQRLNQDMMKMSSRLQTLEEFEASGEGYYQGVQAVLKAKKESKLSGIEGSVLQLLDIPSDYLTAIENALGGAAQNIVVQNDRDAQEAIAWLKREKRGRVTFMPMNLVKGKRQDVHFDSDAVLGLALDLVNFAPEYEAIMAQLLGRVWIIKDLESATKLAKQTGAKHRFVTLEGDVIAPGGTMTGGHAKKQSSIVYRKHEMSALREKIATMQKALTASKEKGEGLRESFVALQTKENAWLEEAQQHQLARREAEVVLNQLGTQLAQLEREIKLEKMNQVELDEQRGASVTKVEVLHNEAEQLTEALVSNEEKQKAHQTELDTHESALSSLQKDVQEALVQKAKAEEQLSLLQERVRTAQAQEKQLSEAIAAQTAQKEHFLKESEELQKNLAKTREKWQLSQKAFEESSKAIQTVKEDIDARSVALREAENEIASLRRECDKLWKEQNALEIKLQRVQGNVGRIETTLLEQFELSPEAAIAKANFELDLTNASSKIAALRDKIRRLGEINFTALEEYESVSTQAAFLSKQMEDLTQAKEKLEAVIREMEQTMAERFKETYDVVNKQFSEVFAAMFGGGSAHLELSLPGRYLETGVEIIAQPPGKKERVLTLLSGGERALTAAALLFALLEVRPSPFVILDEIEAALDEANVERFASFIKQYTDKTQFIIISHRKGTMEAATVLYGITMDANGVSKQVSVRLSDYEE